MKMLCYSLPSIPDHGCSVNELRRILRKANPGFFVVNVFRLTDRCGPTSMVSVSLRAKKTEETLTSRPVIIGDKEYPARPVWIDRRSSVFNMDLILAALPSEASLSRKKKRLS